MANIQLTRNMKLLRESHNLTQDAIAGIFSISRQAYSNYETGKREPDLNFIIQFAEYFHYTLEQLILHPISLNKDQVCEEKGPYTLSVQEHSSKKLLLSEKEVRLIMKYRTASDDDRRIIDKFLSLDKKG